MSDEYFRVQITNAAKEMLRRIGKKYGKKTYEIIRDLIKELEFDPEKKGHRLGGPLHGHFSLHYSRFRILYTIQKDMAVVLVVAAGHHQSGSRSDIYRVIERLVESGQLELRPSEDD